MSLENKWKILVKGISLEEGTTLKFKVELLKWKIKVLEYYHQDNVK